MIVILETAADFFYDPTVYWGLPLLLALFVELATRRGSPGNGRR